MNQYIDFPLDLCAVLQNMVGKRTGAPLVKSMSYEFLFCKFSK